MYRLDSRNQGDALTKFYSKEDEFKEVLKSGEVPDKAIYKEFVESETRKINEGALQIDFVISSNNIDRMHDTINQDGWDLKAFKKNPVVLWAHDQGQPPVAKAISRSVKTLENKLVATAQFMPADISEFSFMIFQMYKMGFMNATSVGFRPTKWSFAEDADRPYGVNFEKQELLEFSCVPVPANSDALISAKSMGLNTRPLKAWVESTLDGWKEDNGLMVPRSDIESLYKSLSARAVLLNPIEEAMKTNKEEIPEIKAAGDDNPGGNHNPELVASMAEAHAMHACAINLHRQANAIHTKANATLKKLFDPNGPQDGDGTDYSVDGKSLPETVVIEKTIEKNIEVKDLDLAAKKALLDELTTAIKAEDKDFEFTIVKTVLVMEVKETTPEVTETQEVETEVKSDENEDFIILFDDSVDKDESSVSFEDVKELLSDALPDLEALIQASVEARLKSQAV